MKSNYQMLVTFKDWTPQRFGFISTEEFNTIYDHFKLKERTNVELQNLRDFIVLYYSVKMDNDKLTANEKYTQSDIMSALTYVVDSEKVERGMEV